jgi:hypothetical protein
MLDSSISQADGLRLLAAPNAARVIAMASHGDQQDELPLLWSLCTAIFESGYSVAVLDATTTESAENPGLANLMDDSHWYGNVLADQMPWSVIPSAHGLDILTEAGLDSDDALQQLGKLFPRYGVLVIYAPTEALVSLLPDSGLEPLLAVSSMQRSLVSAYQALKRLLLDANLKPTIASIMPFPVRSNNVDLSQTMSQRLRECAMTYLGYKLDAQSVPAHLSDESPSDEISLLSTRLLENAKSLYRDTMCSPREPDTHHVHNKLLGSH